jgi:hypothetical protein
MDALGFEKLDVIEPFAGGLCWGVADRWNRAQGACGHRSRPMRRREVVGDRCHLSFLLGIAPENTKPAAAGILQRGLRGTL